MIQFVFFTLFIITLIAGAFSYFLPIRQPLSSYQTLMDKINYEPAEESSTKEYQQLSVTTNKGVVQVRRQMDALAQEQKKLTEMIDDDQQVLNSTNMEIADIEKQMSGRNDIDLLRLKPLVLELQNNQRLLVDRGQSLMAFNDQLAKSRLWLAQQNNVLNFNNEASLRLMRQEDDSFNDRSSALFDKVKQQNNDLLEHTQDLIDEEHQKSEDRQK